MIVVVDLEGVLSAGRTWRALGRYLVTHGCALRYLRFVLRRLPGLLLALCWPPARASLYRRLLRDQVRLLRGTTVQDFNRIAAWIVEHELWPRRRSEIIAALRAHQIAGERVLITSASYQPVLEHFARKLGAEALGSPLEVANEALTGRLVGALNIGEVKAQRLHELLGEVRLYAAYGDTGADIPMLLLSDHPVAVYPDRRLRATARALGWMVLEPNR